MDGQRHSIQPSLTNAHGSIDINFHISLGNDQVYSCKMDKDPKPSKYTAQLFDCGVPGKIQLLQIPETCDEASKEGEMATLQETYDLSPRKLKKASGTSCCASVSEFRRY